MDKNLYDFISLVTSSPLFWVELIFKPVFFSRRSLCHLQISKIDIYWIGIGGGGESLTDIDGAYSKGNTMNVRMKN